MVVKLNKLKDFIFPYLIFFLIGQGFFEFVNGESNCQSFNTDESYCLPYGKCNQYLEYLKSKYATDDLDSLRDQLLCNKISRIHICCDELNIKATRINKAHEYISSLHPRGLHILSSLRECGNATSPRIAFGVTTKLGDVPWMALIEYDVPDAPFQCGGSLISLRYVLTAAHCLKRDDKINAVILGEYNLLTNPDCQRRRGRTVCSKRERFGIEKIIPHPNYNKLTNDFDIGLIKLNRPVTMHKYILPICLPITPSTLRKLEEYKIAGWGTTQSGSTSNVLQSASVNYNENDVCRKIFRRRNITKNLMCIGGEGAMSSCKGDSGGPLFNNLPYVPYERRFIQYGIVSLGGLDCSALQKNPAIYTNVTEFMPWITSNIEE